VRITTNELDTESNPHLTTKQHLGGEVSIQLNIQRGPRKVRHYRQSSLNRIKNRKPG